MDREKDTNGCEYLGENQSHTCFWEMVFWVGAHSQELMTITQLNRNMTQKTSFILIIHTLYISFYAGESQHNSSHLSHLQLHPVVAELRLVTVFAGGC